MTIERFDGTQWAGFSNFHPSAVGGFRFDRFTYPTVEHAFQASKTSVDAEHEAIRTAATPTLAKRLGRKATIRPDWDEVRIDIMRVLLRQKFFTHNDLGDLLLASGEEDLVEGNTWGDRFWGRVDGVGENHLGILLVETRELLKEWAAAPIGGEK